MFKRQATGFSQSDKGEVQTAEGKLHLCIDLTELPSPRHSPDNGIEQRLTKPHQPFSHEDQVECLNRTIK